MSSEGTETTILQCETCGRAFEGVLAAELHASRKNHVNFIDISDEEGARELAAPKPRPVGAAGARYDIGDGQWPTYESQGPSQSPSPRLPTAEEILEKQKLQEEKKRQIAELTAKRRVEKKQQDDELLRIRRNIEIDRARRLETSRSRNNSRPVTPTGQGLAPSSRSVTPITSRSRPTTPNTTKLGDGTATREGLPPTPPRSPGLAGVVVESTKSTPAITVEKVPETRLRLRVLGGANLDMKFPVDAKISEVAKAVLAETKGPFAVASFVQSMPRKAWSEEDFGLTLQEAGLGQSTALTVKLKEKIEETRLRLRVLGRSGAGLDLKFPVHAKISDLAKAVSAETNGEVASFVQNMPRKVWSEADFGLTLQEAGLGQSTALTVKLKV